MAATSEEEEIKERKWRREIQREGIKNDHEGREARRRRGSVKSQRKRGRGEEGRVLVEGDIGKSHITMGVRKVHLVAFVSKSS